MYVVEITRQGYVPRRVLVDESGVKFAVVEALHRTWSGASKLHLKSAVFRIMNEHAMQIALDNNYFICKVRKENEDESKVKIYAYNSVE